MFITGTQDVMAGSDGMINRFGLVGLALYPRYTRRKTAAASGQPVYGRHHPVDDVKQAILGRSKGRV
jgi:hypothetical protein